MSARPRHAMVARAVARGEPPQRQLNSPSLADCIRARRTCAPVCVCLCVCVARWWRWLQGISNPIRRLETDGDSVCDDLTNSPFVFFFCFPLRLFCFLSLRLPTLPLAVDFPPYSSPPSPS